MIFFFFFKEKHYQIASCILWKTDGQQKKMQNDQLGSGAEGHGKNNGGSLP